MKTILKIIVFAILGALMGVAVNAMVVPPTILKFPMVFGDGIGPFLKIDDSRLLLIDSTTNKKLLIQ